MNKILLSGLVGVSLVFGGYYFFKGEEKSKARIEYSDEFDDGPNVFDPNAATDWEVAGKPFHAVITDDKSHLNQNENKNEVIIDGIKYEKIKGYLLPPEPDKELNDSTVGGVDVNNNYVRDDLERQYFNYYSERELKNQFGVIMMIARSYQLHMLKNNKEYDGELLDFHGLYSKAKGSLGVAPGGGVRKSIGNTDERKMKLPGIGGGVYESLMPNRFTRYAYKDFSFDNEDYSDFSGYKIDMEYYEDKPFPKFNDIGSINGLYYKGKSEDIRGKKFWLLNYGVDNKKEALKLGEEKKNEIEEARRTNNYERQKELITTILKDTMERYNEGSWND